MVVPLAARLVAAVAGGLLVLAAWTSVTGTLIVSRSVGSWLTRWVEGKTFEQALVISAEDLMRVLGGLPLGKEHAATLAVKALKDALQQAADKVSVRECQQDTQGEKA